jgi:hypothetical protein
LLAGPGLAALGLALGACAGRGKPPGDPFAGVSAAERYAGIGLADDPPLVVEGRPIDWPEILPRLAEAAGATVVEELTLDRLVEREAAARAVTIGPDDLARERDWLARAIERDAETDPRALVTELRRRRGLGPHRFEALLRRNALLRAMVAAQVRVTEDQLRLAHRVRHGEKVRIRVLTTPDLAHAQRLRASLDQADPARLEPEFADAARERSTDPSAPRGGLVEPFSTADPAYEAAVRSALDTMQPGQLSPIVTLASGYALLYLVERIPADGTPFEAARTHLEHQLARRQERLLMDELANRLLASASVRVPDPSLDWSVDAARDR